MRHECNKMYNDSWGHCTVCDGRLHDRDCTSKRLPAKDCCEARHKRLFNAGQIRGLFDDSFVMWSDTEPLGYHSLT